LVWTYSTLGGYQSYESAEENLKKVTYMYPQLLFPHFLLAKLYHSTGFKAKAISELQFIIEFKPKIQSKEVRMIKRDSRRFLDHILSK